MLAPAAFTARAVSINCSRDSTEQCPAITTNSPFPISIRPTRTTVRCARSCRLTSLNAKGPSLSLERNSLGVRPSTHRRTSCCCLAVLAVGVSTLLDSYMMRRNSLLTALSSRGPELLLCTRSSTSYSRSWSTSGIPPALFNTPTLAASLARMLSS